MHFNYFNIWEEFQLSGKPVEISTKIFELDEPKGDITELKRKEEEESVAQKKAKAMKKKVKPYYLFIFPCCFV